MLKDMEFTGKKTGTYSLRLMTCVLVFLASFLFSSVALASDEDPTAIGFDLRMEVLPESISVPPLYLNGLSTGFRVYAKPQSTAVFYKIGLFVDDRLVPIDERQFDNTTIEYYLSSNTSTYEELRDLLPEGVHTIRFMYMADVFSAYEELEAFHVESDFSAPEGNLHYKTTQDKKLLSIGDEVTLTFSPAAPLDVESVYFKFNSQILRGQTIGDLYEFHYTVVEGTYYESGEIFCDVMDRAGNLTEFSLPTDFIIDGVAPVAKIISPANGGRYNQKSLDLDYSIEGDYISDRTRVLLDGIIINDRNLNNLSDGMHTLSILCEDQAGNHSVVEASFEVDTAPPMLNIGNSVDSQKIEYGKSIVIEGQSEPGAIVGLEVHSDVLKFETVADPLGKFKFCFSSELLSTGSHEFFLILTDQLANTITINLGSIEIFKVSEEVTQGGSDKKLALAPDTTLTDVNPVIYEKSGISSTAPEPEELTVNTGKILTATDQKVGQSAWIFYVLAIGLVVIVIVALAAGYYGYELLFGANTNSHLIADTFKKKNDRVSDNQKKPKESTTIETKDSAPTDDEPQARW